MSTIILTGGGTAGHVMPNINLSSELKKYFDKIVYIGSENGIEEKLIKSQTNYEYKSIPVTKFIRNNIFKNILMPFKLLKSIGAAKKILVAQKPSIVFSKGGYVGLPVVIAASKLKIPVVCHESDFSMGLANTIAKKFANVICTNFEITAKRNGKKCVYTGMPLKLCKLTKSEAKANLNINTNKPILLVTGGSLGAKTINDFIFKNINQLTNKYYVLHLVGKGNLSNKIKNASYKQIEFSNDMWTIFKAADFAISRAGANTIVELLSNNIPTIFIPLPKNISRGDQIENAKYLESIGVAKMLLQNELNLTNVFELLKILQTSESKIKENIKHQHFEDGTTKIMTQILSNKKD